MNRIDLVKSLENLQQARNKIDTEIETVRKQFQEFDENTIQEGDWFIFSGAPGMELDINKCVDVSDTHAYGPYGESYKLKFCTKLTKEMLVKAGIIK